MLPQRWDPPPASSQRGPAPFSVFSQVSLSPLPAAPQLRLGEQTKIQRWFCGLTVLYVHANLPSLVGNLRRAPLCHWSHWLRHGLQQSAVEVGHEESRVGVLLHEAEDDPLGVVEAQRGGRLDVPSDHVSGFVVNVDLKVKERKAVSGGRNPKVMGGLSEGAAAVRPPLSQPRPGCSV